MAASVIQFASEALANRLVAGIPAAARAVAALAQAQEQAQAQGSGDGSVLRCIVAVPGGWAPTRWCREELRRLAPGVVVEYGDAADLDGDRGAGAMSGAMLVVRDAARPPAGPDAAAPANAAARQRAEAALLEAASRAIIASTGKATDGIVSRYLNRPISRLLTRQLLRLPRVVPLHATLVAGATGLAMAACLFSGSETGLVAGAILFHAASVIDGVDGEIARATQRSSQAGATLDSLTDGLTNLAFIAGVSTNLWVRGDPIGAAAGASGLAVLALGLCLLAWRSLAAGGPLNFDAVKGHFDTGRSALAAALAKLTSRDFYAAAFAVAVALGFARLAVLAFAGAAAVWLTVVALVLWRTRPKPAERAQARASPRP